MIQAELMEPVTGIKEPNVKISDMMKPLVMRNRETAFLKLDTQKWVKIDFSAIVYIEAREKLSILFFADGEHLICKSPLYKVQCILPIGFERIHRTYIVNVKWVDFVDVNKKVVNLKNSVSLGLGLAYRDCIVKYFVNPNTHYIDKE